MTAKATEFRSRIAYLEVALTGINARDPGVFVPLLPPPPPRRDRFVDGMESAVSRPADRLAAADRFALRTAGIDTLKCCATARDILGVGARTKLEEIDDDATDRGDATSAASATTTARESVRFRFDIRAISLSFHGLSFILHRARRHRVRWSRSLSRDLDSDQ